MSTTEVEADPVRALQGLSQLANAPDPPLETIRLILSSYCFSESQNNRKRSHKTDLKHGRSKKAREDDRIARWPCEVCSRSFSNKANLKRHVKSAHDKRRLIAFATEVFECEECEDTFAAQAALETHMNTHATTSTNAKSHKYPCAFCNKECANIYNHYGGHHKIDYPEQILFEKGTVLVRSDINSDNGKAPWFLKEKEKMDLYDDVTCRLCEAKTSFGNPEILADHYMLYHMVDPAILDNLKRLFRADKGAHLIGLTPSKTPMRRKSVATAREKDPCRMDGKTETHKASLKTNVKKSIIRDTIDCRECGLVYATEALLDKHKNDKHGPKTKEKPKSKKYKCDLCHKEVVQIYKHYGNVHMIEYPEQMLFDNGNVLVSTVIDTNRGQAPWFLSEREKADGRYTRNTCRLCETEYNNADLLEKHYLTEHKVKQDVLNRLNYLRCLFRAEKGADLADQPASCATKRQHRMSSHTTRPVNKTESKCSDVIAHAGQKAIEEDASGLIMYQCAECGVAATTCDASVEHALLHQLAGGYKPIPLTCDICTLAFEAQCFADHTTHHLSIKEYTMVKFHPSKLLDDWAEMFQGLSESHVDRIKASSIYQYTRRVKMNSDVISGIPLYQCGKCELYVRPKDVEAHCYSKTSCVEIQAPGHFCSDCEIFFYTGAALTAHEKEHRNYGNNSFRKVTFNCREDETLNQALQKLGRVTVEEPIKILGNDLVSKFCNECNKFILISEFEAHVAMHKVNNDTLFEPENNQRIEADKGEHSGEVATQNAATEESDVGGTVEQWNSDNDSCLSLQISSNTVHADVHVPSDPVVMSNKNNDVEIGATNDVQNAENNSEVVISSYAEDNIILDEFSEDMTNELKRDIHHLGFKEFCINMNKWAFIPDDITTDDLLETLENDAMRTPNSSNFSDSENKNTQANTSQGIFLSYPNVTQIGNESHTILGATTQTKENNVESKSSRYILNRMLSGDESAQPYLEDNKVL